MIPRKKGQEKKGKYTYNKVFERVGFLQNRIFFYRCKNFKHSFLKSWKITRPKIRGEKFILLRIKHMAAGQVGNETALISPFIIPLSLFVPITPSSFIQADLDNWELNNWEIWLNKENVLGLKTPLNENDFASICNIIENL